MSEHVVARARSLLGVRFRPQGRCPDIGLDCIGVVLHALNISRARVRSDYTIRGDHADAIGEALRGLGLVTVTDVRAGDVVLFDVAADQVHFGVFSGESFIHADASLGEVVETPWPPSWPIISAHRQCIHREDRPWQP